MKENIYAIYKGDEFIFMGTAKECGEYLGVKPESIRFRTTPAYQRRVKNIYEQRTIVIKVEE